MNLLKKFSLVLFTCFSISFVHAQYEINPVEGYSPQVGVMVDMLEDLKTRITDMTKDLNQTETDFLFDAEANSIAALIMHVVATEAYYQVQTIEGKKWSEKEAEFWGVGASLGGEHSHELTGKPIQYYLDLWDEVRSKTLEGMKTKDDAWLAANIDEGVNNHWVWFHVLEHSANHMGQMALIKNRLPKKQ